MTAQTIYERVLFIYSRYEENILTARKQRNADCSLEEVLTELQNATTYSDCTTTFAGLGIRSTLTYMCFEMNTKDVILGLVTRSFRPTPFDVWFVKTVLSNSTISFKLHPELCGTEASLSMSDLKFGYAAAANITEIFETTIKNKGTVDRWEEGRLLFLEHVRFFTSKNIPVEAVLPAFPCKSSNADKVADWVPDMAEELAIRRIIEFVNLVKAVYPPGLKFFIVSDGHVFSDCINVDDDVVDRYTQHLVDLYENIKPDGFDGIIFRGLNHCFESDLKEHVMPILEGIEIDHHLETSLDVATEINRKILMLGCDDNAELIREQIKTPGHSRLYLYRGFNKFMYEDLMNTPTAKSLSGKKFKKLVGQVAYEMIRRNDAYSNLVELIFPFHLRLSIHAHHNAGPKFGIQLLNPQMCCTYNHNKAEEDRLLHIPTPWHNAIFVIEGQEKLIVSSAKLAQIYMDDCRYTGGWDAKQKCFRFLLNNRPKFDSVPLL